MIRVLLADDHSIVRAGLRRIVEESGDIEVVAEASDGREAVLAVRKEKPDVAVIDISMPVLDGLEVITQLKSEFPEVPILVLTMHEEHQYVVRAIETGAMGYITKQSAPEQLVKAIRKVHSGSLFLTDEAAEALALRVAKGNKAQSPLDSLSTRELQVLQTPGLGQHQPRDRLSLSYQHQNSGYLSVPSAEEIKPAQQRRPVPLCHPEPPHRNLNKRFQPSN